jgi:ATP-dependent Clp protease ATP-binding subunit ClpA
MKDKKKIYPYEKQLNFIRLMDEAMNENIEEIDKELEDAGIDIKEVQEKLLNFIRKERAKLNYERGQLFRKNYEEEKQNNPNVILTDDIAFAFRTNGDSNLKDSINEEELKKLSVLRKAKDKLKGNQDEQSDRNG